MALTDIQVRSSKPKGKSYKLSGGDGLFLPVDVKNKTFKEPILPILSGTDEKQK